MPQLSRRFFLGGLLSVGAASVVAPTIKSFEAMADPWVGSNLPRIFANGRDFDSDGFIALLQGREVIFPKDKIAISDAKDIIVHSGEFLIDREVSFHDFRTFKIESGTFDGSALREPWMAIFSFPSGFYHFPSDEENMEVHFRAEDVINNPRIKFVRRGERLACKVRRTLEVRYDCNKVAYWQGSMEYPKEAEI